MEIRIYQSLRYIKNTVLKDFAYTIKNKLSVSLRIQQALPAIKLGTKLVENSTKKPNI